MKGLGHIFLQRVKRGKQKLKKKKKKKQKQEVKALRRDFCCLNHVYRVVLLDKNERLGNPKL